MSHEEFVVEDYKLALQYLQAQFERLWQRFGLFLTVQMALFGFVGWLAYEKGKVLAVPLVAILGTVIALLWYVVAAQDRYLVDAYRDRTKFAARRVASISEFQANDYESTYVGSPAPSHFCSPLSWYWEHTSITRLPVWIAGGLIIVWLALLCKGASWLGPPQ